ncbi:MAG: type II secretion system F family protein, partial [Planctomycetaceae bacterium]
GFGGTYGGRLGTLMSRLASRMSAGETLPDAIAAESRSFPRACVALIEAGLATGRLPEVLESLSRFTRSLLDVRRRIALALIYPCVVLVAAYYLFCFLLGQPVSMLVETYRMFGLEERAWMPLAETLGESVEVWMHLPPAALLLLVAGWFAAGWLRGPTGLGGVGLRWLPGARGLLRNHYRATFAELLAMLVEHGVPLPDALRLAAESTGSRPLITAAESIARDVQSGRPLLAVLKDRRDLPPFLRWMMTADPLAPALRQVAEVYRRRAQRTAEWMQSVLPLVVTVVVLGGAVLVYALTLFLPLTGLLKELVPE